MLELLTFLFWSVVILASYVGYKYQNSRNKSLLLKDGTYKASLYSLLLLVGGGALITWLSPTIPSDLSSLQLHSDWVMSQQEQEPSLKGYLFKSLAVFSELNLLGLFSAILIWYIWFYYIRGLDFFHTEGTAPTLFVIFFGMFVTFFTFPLSDFVKQTFDITYTESIINNLFLYSFLGIGVVEEFIKLIPVLCILLFTREVDEPIDLIYYAGLSALGFAFIENLLYFREMSGGIVIGRALYAAAGHIIDATIVVYGIVLYKFDPNRKNVWVIIQYFLLGAFVHGLYDFLLFENQTLLFLLGFAFVVQAWAILINNAINNSPHFSYAILYQHHRVKFRLAMLLVGLLLFGFLINGLISGRQVALEAYIGSLLWGGLLILFYVSSISSFDLVQGYWRPVKFRLRNPSDRALLGVRGFSIFSSLFTENTINPQNHVGKKIKLHCPGYNRDLLEIFHIGSGQITDRIKLSIAEDEFDNDWFLVKLDTTLEVNDQVEDDRILIKIRSLHASFIHDTHIECWLKLIPKGLDPRQHSDAKAYFSYGYIMLNGEDYEHDPQLQLST